jgi:hypothetical protein
MARGFDGFDIPPAMAAAYGPHMEPWAGIDTTLYDDPTTVGVKQETSNMNGAYLRQGPPGVGGYAGVPAWLPPVISAGAAVYNAVWGGDESGKGETVAETSDAEWYTDMPYASVPTRAQVGAPHGHPHPRGLVHRRRRRRKLLTASDKADIAFITGTLGKGEMGRTAIAALLSRRMS